MRSFDTDHAAYDARLLGWKYTEADTPGTAPRLRYDQARASNHGHTYGDYLSEAGAGGYRVSEDALTATIRGITWAMILACLAASSC